MGEKIRQDRKALGWNLKDLASRVGIRITTLQRIETNMIGPSVALMVKIASKLHKPVSYYILNKKANCAMIKAKEGPAAETQPAEGYQGGSFCAVRSPSGRKAKSLSSLQAMLVFSMPISLTLKNSWKRPRLLV